MFRFLPILVSRMHKGMFDLAVPTICNIEEDHMLFSVFSVDICYNIYSIRTQKKIRPQKKKEPPGQKL
jgi:hypothetical protein